MTDGQNLGERRSFTFSKYSPASCGSCKTKGIGNLFVMKLPLRLRCLGLFLSFLPSFPWVTPYGVKTSLRLPICSKICPRLQSVTLRGDRIVLLSESRNKAFPQQTPHSGRHFEPNHPAYRRRWLARIRARRRRFMEGWFYRLTLSEGVSFSIIVSIEDVSNPKSGLGLVCVQILGPDGGYLIQADKDDSKFWAHKSRQGLGNVFDYHRQYTEDNGIRVRTELTQDEWYNAVESGFQISPTEFVGRLRGYNGSIQNLTLGESFADTDPNMMCDFNFTVVPLCGWGDADGIQKSTGGWLSSYRVFDPHWQVTLADARASGQIMWNGKVYHFAQAPFYAEKNWGAALPPKWFWTQCNSFDGYNQLSVTAGGGIRSIPWGRKEALGMICVHFDGMFFEAVPWSGHMEWQVSTWGIWKLSGNSTFGSRPFAIEVTYECDAEKIPGLDFRAPTPDEGMVFFCRDTFVANTTLTLWELDWNVTTKSYFRKPGPPLIDRATSSQGGAEIGGGPWWSTWEATSVVKQPLKALLQIPARVQNYRRKRSQAWSAMSTEENSK